MASQPPDTGRDRNQVRPLRSTVSSVRGKANRHRSTGVFGPHFVLDCVGSRKQAARFQDLLQQPSHPYLNGRANAESALTGLPSLSLLSYVTWPVLGSQVHVRERFTFKAGSCRTIS